MPTDDEVAQAVEDSLKPWPIVSEVDPTFEGRWRVPIDATSELLVQVMPGTYKLEVFEDLTVDVCATRMDGEYEVYSSTTRARAIIGSPPIIPTESNNHG